MLPQEREYWSQLDQLVTFLKPFQLATDVMQKDSSTMYDCFLQFKHLLTHVRVLAAILRLLSCSRRDCQRHHRLVGEAHQPRRHHLLLSAVLRQLSALQLP